MPGVKTIVAALLYPSGWTQLLLGAKRHHLANRMCRVGKDSQGPLNPTPCPAHETPRVSPPWLRLLSKHSLNSVGLVQHEESLISINALSA